MDAKSRYRMLQVSEGGQKRRVYGARKAVAREGHALALQTLQAVEDTIPVANQNWAWDVRRKRMTVYGGVLLFLEVLHRKGVPMETALMVPRWIESYVRDVWQDEPAAPALSVDQAA